MIAIVLKSFSKVYGSAGGRAGVILAQPELIEWLSKCGTQFALSKLAQAGAAAAMRDTEHGVYVKEKVAQSRSYLQEELKKLGCKVYDSQTNFIFFDPLVDPVELSMKLSLIHIFYDTGGELCGVHQKGTFFRF